jgi:hypothetical protein
MFHFSVTGKSNYGFSNEEHWFDSTDRESDIRYAHKDLLNRNDYYISCSDLGKCSAPFPVPVLAFSMLEAALCYFCFQFYVGSDPNPSVFRTILHLPVLDFCILYIYLPTYLVFHSLKQQQKVLRPFLNDCNFFR